MKKRNMVRLKMIENVLTFCRQHPAPVDSLPALKASLARLQSLYDRIRAVGTDASIQVDGVQDAKENADERLIDLLSPFCSSVYAYAADTGNQELRGEVDFSDYSFARLPEQQLSLTANRILEFTARHIAALADYGVTATDVTEIKDALASYDAYLMAPRRAITHRSQSIDTSGELLKEAETLLRESIDKVAIRLNKPHPAFYKEYLENRLIIGPATRRTGIEVRVASARDDHPLAGAAITLDGTHIAIVTDAGGRCIIRDIEPGTHTVTISHKDFTGKTVADVRVLLGKTAKVKTTLEAV
jgi:hypothetical protein